jgi:hypothetical protein
MLNAALLLPMLEAVHGPRFTISLKRSTPNLQLSTRKQAGYPILWGLIRNHLLSSSLIADSCSITCADAGGLDYLSKVIAFKRAAVSR